MTAKAYLAAVGMTAVLVVAGATSATAASASETALVRAAAGPYPNEAYTQANPEVRGPPPGGAGARPQGGAPGGRPGGGGPAFAGRPGPGPGGAGGPGYGYRRGPSGGAVAAGVLGGLAAGALVGGAIASQPGPGYYGYRDGYYPPPGAYDPGPVEYGAAMPVGNVYGRDPRWVNYCASRYPGFDPASGTYLAADGYRYPCR